MKRLFYLTTILCCQLLFAVPSQALPSWPFHTKPGKAQVSSKSGQEFQLFNKLLQVDWKVKNGTLTLQKIIDKDKRNSVSFNGISDFYFVSDQNTIDGNSFKLKSNPTIVKIKPNKNSPRAIGSVEGVSINATLINKEAGYTIDWKAELRDDSNYIRQEYVIKRLKDHAVDSLSKIVMLRLPEKYQKDNYLGTVPGSPYLLNNTEIIAGVEQPAYWAQESTLNSAVTDLAMPTKLAVGADDSYQINTMIGIFPKSQRRRTFLYYIERERATPSRTYLHYNTWYDLSELSNKTVEDVAQAYYQELTQKRGVHLDGFVLDDGWDDYNDGLWQPDKKRFGGSFRTVDNFLKTHGGEHLGLWLSPYGGYGGHDERMEIAKRMGALPKDAKSFDMGYPSYYKEFKRLCLSYMNGDGVDYFKWDNAAPYENEGRTFSNLQSTSHFMQLTKLANELHEVNHNLFLNTTVGTWPSPFWLNFVDTTWRMGKADVYWIGKGDKREQSLNYRDGEVYNMVVKRAPLYPLNSMMFHGVVLGHLYQAETTSKAGNKMKNEFRSYFALGTNLQELYLSPDMMSAENWDDLAEAIKWNKKNARVLIDTHWVQGDPNKGEPYVIASWHNNKGVISLRNPDDQPREVKIDIQNAFELPVQSVKKYTLESPYRDQRIQQVKAEAGKSITIQLNPFEVLIFDAVPE